MPFENPITGGQGALVRPAIKSPNYATGSMGWTINADGTAEFNGATFRGTIIEGTAGGARIEIGPGNTINIYDSLGRLVTTLDSTQILIQDPAGSGRFIQLTPNPCEIDMAPPTGTFSYGRAIINTDKDANDSPILTIEGANIAGQNWPTIDLIGENTGIGFKNNVKIYPSGGNLELWVEGPTYLTSGNGATREDWHNVTFVNNWTGTLQYRKVSSPPNSLQLSGTAHSPNPYIASTVTTLPAGWRTASTHRIPITRDIDSAVTQCAMNSAGVIAITLNTPGVDWFFDFTIPLDR